MVSNIIIEFRPCGMGVCRSESRKPLVPVEHLAHSAPTERSYGSHVISWQSGGTGESATLFRRSVDVHESVP